MMEPKEPIPASHKREVFALIKVEGDDREKWVRCGIGFVNRDGSITVLLDCMPVNSGKLIIREWETRAEKMPAGSKP